MTEQPDFSLILIVEDEIKLAELLRDYLQQSGYRTHIISHGDQVVDWIKSHAPNLMLLDLMLPGRDGMTLCREVRAFSELPIIMVTARVEEIDRLLGLELGADDYVCKPYSPREVVARVKANLRRVRLATSQVPTANGFELDEARHYAAFKGRPLDLTPVEFRLLAALLSTPIRVWSRDTLMNVTYTDRRIVTHRTVDSHIKNLRKKIEAIDAEGPRLRSIYGVGYTLSD